MAFTPFVETDAPTMAAFNQKFAQAIEEAESGALARGTKFAKGSYKGTNKSGASNPNTLTFDFAPQVVIIAYANNVAIFVRDCNMASVYGSGGINVNSSVLGWYISNVTWGEKSLSWYVAGGTSMNDTQLNASAYTYNYIAIG